MATKEPYKNIDDVCFIIYARLGSERAPGKMLRPFAGTTLINLALGKIKRSIMIRMSNFHLCVHEPELIARGRQAGVNVFVRSEASAKEDSHLPTLMEWWDKLPYTYCVAISACHPFLSIETVDKFIRDYINSEHDGMFAVVERRNYYWNKMGNLITPWPRGEDLLNTKAVETTYEAANTMWAGRLDTIGDGKWMGSFQAPNDPALFVIDEEREVLDIDYPWQFDMCESYFNSMKRESLDENV